MKKLINDYWKSVHNESLTDDELTHEFLVFDESFQRYVINESQQNREQFYKASLDTLLWYANAEMNAHHTEETRALRYLKLSLTTVVIGLGNFGIRLNKESFDELCTYGYDENITNIIRPHIAKDSNQSNLSKDTMDLDELFEDEKRIGGKSPQEKSAIFIDKILELNNQSPKPKYYASMIAKIFFELGTTIKFEEEIHETKLGKIFIRHGARLKNNGVGSIKKAFQSIEKDKKKRAEERNKAAKKRADERAKEREEKEKAKEHDLNGMANGDAW